MDYKQYGVSYEWKILPVELSSEGAYTKPNKLANCLFTGTKEECEKFVEKNKPAEKAPLKKTGGINGF